MTRQQLVTEIVAGLDANGNREITGPFLADLLVKLAVNSYSKEDEELATPEDLAKFITIRNNPPTVGDDLGAGFLRGYTIISTSTTPPVIWECTSNANGAAVWVNGGVDSLKYVKGGGGNFSSYAEMKAFFAAIPGLKQSAMETGVANEYLSLSHLAAYGGTLYADSIYFTGIMDRETQDFSSGVTQFHLPSRTWRYFTNTVGLGGNNPQQPPVLFADNLLFPGASLHRFDLKKNEFKADITGGLGGTLISGISLSNGKMLVHTYTQEYDGGGSLLNSHALQVINPVTWAVDLTYVHTSPFTQFRAMAEVGGQIFVLQNAGSGDDKILVLSLSLVLSQTVTLTGFGRGLTVWGTKFVMIKGSSDAVDIFDTATKTVTSSFALNASQGQTMSAVISGNTLFAAITSAGASTLKQVNLLTNSILYTKPLGTDYVLDMKVDATYVYTIGTRIVQCAKSNIASYAVEHALAATERAVFGVPYNNKLYTFSDYPSARLRILNSNVGFERFAERYLLEDAATSKFVQTYPLPFTGDATVAQATTSFPGTVRLASALTDAGTVPPSALVKAAIDAKEPSFSKNTGFNKNFVAPADRFNATITDQLACPADLVATRDAIEGGVDPAFNTLALMNDKIDAGVASISAKTSGFHTRNQVGHGLALYDLTRLNGANRVKAIAANTLTLPLTNLADNENVWSIVTNVVDGDNFVEFRGSGYIDITGMLDQGGSILVSGTPYYLSATVSGKISPTKPSAANQSVHYVLTPVSATLAAFTTEVEGVQVPTAFTLLNSDANGIGTLAVDGAMDATKRTYVIDSSAAARTNALPPLSSFTSGEVLYRVSRKGSNLVTLTPDAGDTIIGGNRILTGDGSSLTFVRTGTNEWRVFAVNDTVGGYTVALLPAVAATGAPLYCSDCLCSQGIGAEVFFNGAAWRTREGIVATTDVYTYMVDCLKSGKSNRGMYEYSFFDDNWIGSGSGEANWFALISGTSASISNFGSNSTALQRLGILEATTGSTATGSARKYKQNAGLRLGDGAVLDAGAIYLPALSSATDEYTVRMGLDNATTVGAASNAAYLEYNRTTSVNWMAQVGSGSTYATAIDTGIAVVAATWMNWAVFINAAGTSVTFYINGVLVATFTTNIPTTLSQMLQIVKSVGTTPAVIREDWRYIHYRRSVSLSVF